MKTILGSVVIILFAVFFDHARLAAEDTHPRQNVMGRIGGGSNYVKLFDDSEPNYLQNLIGRYHQSWPFPTEPPPPRPPPSPVPVAETARKQMAVMYNNSQRKLSLLIHFRPAVYLTEEQRRRKEWVAGFQMIAYSPGPFPADGSYPANVSLSPQQETNLLTFLSDVKRIGFTQINFRFGGVADCADRNWGGVWRQDRYIHNRNYIFSIIRLIERNKGDLKVIYDLGAEHANIRLENNGSVDSNLHRRFCGSLWAAFCNEFGPQNSMAYSCITQFGQARYGRVPLGLVYMMDLFAKDKLPFPGYYGIDTYDTPYVKPPVNNPVYAVLVDTHDFLKKNYPGEELKPCILQESFYNDATVARQIEQALADRPGIRLQSVFQWPKVRGHEKTFFPDIYPKNF